MLGGEMAISWSWAWNCESEVSIFVYPEAELGLVMEFSGPRLGTAKARSA
jgi:hypothetical protein